MILENTKNNNIFLTVLSDGMFHQEVPEGTPNEFKREVELKDGTKKIKNEVSFNKLTGFITNIYFADGDFGKSINVEIDREVIVSMGTSNNFGEDFMKKVPGINLNESVVIRPYSFEDDNKKKRRGINIFQGETKIENFYYDKDKKKSINGIPEMDKANKKPTKEDWIMHFMVVRKFLIEQTEKLIKDFGFSSVKKSIVEEDVISGVEDEEIDTKDIPF